MVMLGEVIVPTIEVGRKRARPAHVLIPRILASTISFLIAYALAGIMRF